MCGHRHSAAFANGRGCPWARSGGNPWFTGTLAVIDAPQEPTPDVLRSRQMCDGTRSVTSSAEPNDSNSAQVAQKARRFDSLYISTQRVQRVLYLDSDIVSPETRGASSTWKAVCSATGLGALLALRVIGRPTFRKYGRSNRREPHPPVCSARA